MKLVKGSSASSVSVPDPYSLATAEELCGSVLVPGSFGAASRELPLFVAPFMCRIDSINWTNSAALSALSGTDCWKFRPRRRRLTYTGASSTAGLDLRDLGNINYTKPVLAFEGTTIDTINFDPTYCILNPYDVLSLSIEVVGTGGTLAGTLISDLCVTWRYVPL